MHDFFLILLIVVACFFDFTNGFHDAANAIATSISTRALSPRSALLMSAFLNVLGALFTTKVADTVGKGIVPPYLVNERIIFAALLGAIGWNLITWNFGIPSSSSHALVGGIAGAGLFTAGLYAVNWKNILEKVLAPAVWSCVLGLVSGFALMIFLSWIFFRSNPTIINKVFKRLQIFSAAAMSFAHGTSDAQKTMGIITMALVSEKILPNFYIPTWVILLCSLVMGIGTAAGGWRIIKTMGMRVIKIEPIQGFSAETCAASSILLASSLGMPVSSTHVISSAIMGAGASRRLSAVRWGVASNIVMAWILTIPASALLAGFFTLFFH
jgi:PiT family inorganic phosphate transporter